MRQAIALIALLAACASTDGETRRKNMNELVGPPEKTDEKVLKAPCADERTALENANSNARLYVEKCGKELGRHANDCKNEKGKNELGICPACDALDAANTAASTALGVFNDCEKRRKEGSMLRAIPSAWWAALRPLPQPPSTGLSSEPVAADHLVHAPASAAR